MQSRLGIASFAIGIAIGVAYLVVRVLTDSAPDALTALSIQLWFLIGAAAAAIVGLVLGVIGWVRGGRAGRKTALAIIGSALDAAVVVWAIVTVVLAFVQQVQLPA